MKKRILLTLLASIMLLTGVMACDDQPVDPVPPVNTGDTSPSPSPTGDTPVIPPVDPALPYAGFNPLDYGMEPFSSPVTLTIGMFDRARDDVPDVSDNYYTRWINEHFGANLNVNVEYIPINRADTMTSYNLLLAANTPPTIFMEYDWPKVSEWAGTGALQSFDLQEFVNIAPTWYQHAGGNLQFDMFKMNGEHFLAPALRPYWNTNYTWVTFYRKDWYREAGLELFTTWEEYADALERFMELGLSNGNPLLPTEPFTANFQFYGDSSWPRDEQEWVMYSDVNVASLPAPGAKNVLKKMNNLYNRGLISDEFDLDIEGAGSAAQRITDFINGESYTYSAYINAAMPDLEAFYANNPNAELGVIYNNSVFTPWTDSWGYHTVPQGRATNPAGFFVGFSSRATADELKAAWLYMEWMAQKDVLEFMQWGTEGITYTQNADGSRDMISWEDQGEMWMGFSNNKDYWAVVEEVRLFGTIEDTIAALTPKNIPQDFTQELIDNYYYQAAAAEAGLFYCDPFFSVDIPSVMEYAGSLTPMFQEFATDLVKCDPSEFDAKYDDYVARYKAAGFQQIMDERLAAYNAGNTTLLPDIPAGRAPFTPYNHTSVVPRLYTIAATSGR